MRQMPTLFTRRMCSEGLIPGRLGDSKGDRGRALTLRCLFLCLSAFFTATCLLCTEDAGAVPQGNQTVLSTPERLAGAIDGVNIIFPLARSLPQGWREQCFRNGIPQKSGIDYAIHGQILTFSPTSVPQAGDSLLLFFRAPAGVSDRALSAQPKPLPLVQTGAAAKHLHDQIALMLADYLIDGEIISRPSGLSAHDSPRGSAQISSTPEPRVPQSRALQMLDQRTSIVDGYFNPTPGHARESDSAAPSASALHSKLVTDRLRLKAKEIQPNGPHGKAAKSGTRQLTPPPTALDMLARRLGDLGLGDSDERIQAPYASKY